MASRFKGMLCMVLSHSPQPFDQQALTVRLHFESWVLKNTRQHLFNSFKCGLWISLWTLHLRAKELTIFRYAIFGSWRRGPWAWAGVAGRWARRHAAPAVVGRFIFFSRLGLFWRFGNSGFGDTDDGRADGRTERTDETGLTPDPHSKNGKSPKILSPFFWRF